MSEPLGPAAVPGNRWRDLHPPALAGWQPSRAVTVILPYYEAPTELARTLAALSVQSYPAGLFDVVVVDDGSEPPLEVAGPAGGPPLRVIHQDDRGFGLARARNTGAAAAGGEILVFLDADMVPEHTWLAAHARWHHTIADALVTGFRRHVDFGSREPDEIRAAVAGGRLAHLFEDGEIEEPEWIDFHMARTADLTAGHHDGFRAITGGNLSIRAELFAELGGFDESFTRWGAEDTEFAYRAYVGGALLIPERAAMAWHQGRGATPDDQEKASLEFQRVKIASLIAHPSFRPDRPARSYLVPRLAVTVDGAGASAGQLVASVDSLLGADVADLAIVVETGGDAGEYARERYRGEPRVAIAGPGAGASSHPAAWARLWLPAGARVGERAVARLLDELDGTGVVTVELPEGGRALAMLTRAWRRAGRLAGPEGLEAAAVELFGHRSLAWQDAGFAAGRDWQPAPGVRGRLQDPGSRTGKVLRYVASSKSPGDFFRVLRWLAGRARRGIGR